MTKQITLALLAMACLLIPACKNPYTDPQDEYKRIDTQQFSLEEAWILEYTQGPNQQMLYFYEEGILYEQSGRTFFHKDWEQINDTIIRVGLRKGKIRFSTDGQHMSISGFDDPYLFKTDANAEGPFINGVYLRQ